MCVYIYIYIVALKLFLTVKNASTYTIGKKFIKGVVIHLTSGTLSLPLKPIRIRVVLEVNETVKGAGDGKYWLLFAS